MDGYTCVEVDELGVLVMPNAGEVLRRVLTLATMRNRNWNLLAITVVLGLRFRIGTAAELHLY